MRHIKYEDLDVLFQQSVPCYRYLPWRLTELIPPDKYRVLMGGFNTKQRQGTAMKKGEVIKPYRVFLSGPGGVGKSCHLPYIQRH